MTPNEAEADAPTTTDIFICYARQDHEFVQRLAEALRQQGKRVWVDRTEPPESAKWQQSSQQEIDAAPNIVVVLSPDFVASLYNYEEVEYAIFLNKRLIPIVYREGFESGGLHPAIFKLNWLYFRESDDFDRALSDLLEVLNSGSETTSPHPENEEDPLGLEKNIPLILHRHQGVVYSVAFSPDGKTIASGSADRTICLWSLDGIPIGQPFRGHQSSVDSMAFSPDGKTIASGSADRTIRLWSLDGTPIGQAFWGHTGSINSVTFSPDGQTLVSGSADNTIRLWNLDGTSIRQPLQGHTGSINSVAFSPDGQTLVSGSADNTIRLWNLDGTLIGQPFIGHEDSVTSVVFSRDGKTIVSGSEDKTIRLWSLNGTPTGKPFQGHQSYVNSVAFSSDGKTIISGSEDGTIRLWAIPYKTQITFISQKLQNDLAKGRDCLNIEHEIHALADILAMRDVEPPLAVGILGGWGSGKSFAMHLIQQRLNEIRSRRLAWNETWTGKNNPYVGHIYQIQFDAWTYAKADLWSSLMQTIFYEFNRQLTLEKQIAEALAQSRAASPQEDKGVRKKSVWQSLKAAIFGILLPEQTPLEVPSFSADDLQQAHLEEGEFWRALNEMSESDRAMILQEKLSSEAFAQLKQSKSQQEFTDYLWKQIGTLRQGEKEALQKKSENLNQEKQKLPSLIARRAVVYFLQKNKLFLITLAIGASIVAYPILPKEIRAKVSDHLDTILLNPAVKYIGTIASVSGGIPVLIRGLSLWEKTREEQSRILEELSKHREAIQGRVNGIKDSTTKFYGEVLKFDLAVREQVEKIQKLETQIDLQQRKLGLSPTTPSLNAFISDRLQADSYIKQLGALQQVQRDLADLTQHFTFPNQGDAAKTELQEKLAKLQQIFPRGPARIVLYIDDLDRCPPDQVVKVLEAVQLILKTPLFIVVLAIDDRYIARALEKVYEGVLTRQGHPSGIDYLEKIIQLPYRMRPISPEGLENYLKSQVDLEEAAVELTENFFREDQTIREIEESEIEIDPEKRAKDLTERAQKIRQQQAVPSSATPDKPILQIIKFTQAEFELIKNCCKHVDISPRTAKRLSNIFKILKIVWSNTSEPEPEIKQTIISFLALSGRYSDFMRYAFIEIDTCFEKADHAEGDRTLIEILSSLPLPSSKSDKHANREWGRFQHDIQQMLPDRLTLNEMGRSTFNLILSFCFVGDIGYDPQDFSKAIDSFSETRDMINSKDSNQF